MEESNRKQPPAPESPTGLYVVERMICGHWFVTGWSDYPHGWGAGTTPTPVTYEVAERGRDAAQGAHPKNLYRVAAYEPAIHNVKAENFDEYVAEFLKAVGIEP